MSTLDIVYRPTHHGGIALVVTALFTLQECGTPPTMTSCEGYTNVEDRLDCMNTVVFGDALRGTALGALAGGAVGAGIGGVVGGPRGAVRGALGGAGVGAVTGAVISYDNAVADMEAEVRHLDLLAATYKEYDTKSQRHVQILQTQLAASDVQSEQHRQAQATLQHELNEKDKEIYTLQSSIQILNGRHHEYEKQGIGTDQYKKSVQSLGDSLNDDHIESDRIRKILENYKIKENKTEEYKTLGASP